MKAFYGVRLGSGESKVNSKGSFMTEVDCDKFLIFENYGEAKHFYDWFKVGQADKMTYITTVYRAYKKTLEKLICDDDCFAEDAGYEYKDSELLECEVSEEA